LIPLRDNIPTDRFPVVTVVIIAINVFVFLFLQGPSFSLSAGDNVESKPVIEYGTIPYRITHPSEDCKIVPPEATTSQTEVIVCEGTPEYREAQQAGVPIEDIRQPPAYLTLFTSMFLHGGWLHIIFNMLFLWIFGNNVEDSMGKPRYILFYLLGGLAAALAQVAVASDSTVPAIGASGAIAAVLGGYALLYPRARVLTLFFLFFIFILELPALLLLGIWVFLQFLPAVGQLANPDVGGQGGVAYWAHVGGFVFGLALVRLFAKRRSSRYGEPRLPVY
jgi:membrane associated rhomboid family serine protease